MPCTYLGHQQYFSHWTYGFSSLTHRHENWDCKRWKYINKKQLGPIIPYKQSREMIKLWTSCAKILAQSHFSTPNQHQPYIILHPKHIVPCAKRNALPTTQVLWSQSMSFWPEQCKVNILYFSPNFSWGISFMSKCTDHMVYFCVGKSLGLGLMAGSK